MERKSLEEIFGTQPKKKSLEEIFAVETPAEEAVKETSRGQSGLDKALGAATSFDKGYTFGFGKKLGGVMNAIGAAPVDALLTDKSLAQAAKYRYSEIVDDANQAQKQFAEENPMTALGLEVAGGIANPLNKVGADYIGKGATLGSKVLRGVGVGGAGGALNAVGNDGDIATDTGIGAVVGGAFPLAGTAVKGAGKVASKILGKTTGAGDKAIEDAFKAGQKGNLNFIKQMRKPDDIDEVVGKAMKSLDKIKQARSRAYDESMSVLRRDTTKLDINPVTRQIDRISRAEGGGSDYLVGKKTGNVIKEAKEVVDKFAKDKARHNTAGFDDLKQRLSQIETYNEPNAERIKSEITNSVKSEIMKQNPSYKQVMDDYARDSANIDTLKRTFSLDKRANLETTLRKLQSVTRNNANTDYGYRAELLKKIDPTGEIYDAVSAGALNSWSPRGIGFDRSILAGGGALLGGAPGFIASTLASSPRLVGEAAYILGKGASKLPQKDITPYLVQMLTGE